MDEEAKISRVRYHAAKRIAEKAVAVAKNMAYDRLYQKPGTKEGEKEVFKLVRVTERRTRDLGVVRCIKDDDSKVLSDDAEINERWQVYFSKLLNGEVIDDFRRRERESSESQLDPRLHNPLSKDEIKGTLKKMVNGKGEGPDQISVAVWKCLREE